MRIVSSRERPDLSQRAWEATADVWPEYNRHGDVLNDYWGDLDEVFPDFQFVLYDEETDEVVAQGHSIPCAWDGTVAGLPEGIDGMIEDAFRLAAAGEPANSLSAGAIEIPPAHQAKGLSRLMIGHMQELAAGHGLGALIAPVRPSWKERYPLAPIEQYAFWTREDGLPFDSWIRTHVRLGGAILRPEPRSLRITGTVADWEEWVGLVFPESGEYVFPRGLATVAIDREADVGGYWEPNVWMRHGVG
ncbi:MAG: GNAT family N-acetyltransferase [Gaiellaceae bacterium]